MFVLDILYFDFLNEKNTIAEKNRYMFVCKNVHVYQFTEVNIQETMVYSEKLARIQQKQLSTLSRFK